MPRIPLSNAQKIGHTSASVNQQSAPGMNFGMDDARALQGAGDTVGQVGRGLGSALMRFGEQVQQAEDRLAAAEYETAWNNREKALEARMRENPGSVKEFGKWADESDKEWEDEGKQYLDRMSQRQREVFEVNWRRNRDNAVYRRQELTIGAQVKSLQDRYAKQIQDLCQTGDYDGAKRLIGVLIGLETSPFTADQIDGFREFVNKSETFGLLRKAFDSGNAKDIENTLELLKVRNKDGGYLHDLGLTEEERARWIKYGENTLRETENQQCEDALYTYLKDGTYDSEDKLRANSDRMSPHVFAYKMELAKKAKAAEEGRQRDADDKIYYGYIVDYVKSGYKIFPTQEELDKDYNAGKISQALYLKLSSFREKVDSRDKAAAETEARKIQIQHAEAERKKKEAEARYKAGWDLFKKNFLAELMLKGQYPATDEARNIFMKNIMEIPIFNKLSPYQQKELLDLGEKYIKDGNPLQQDVIDYINHIIKGIEGDYGPSAKSIAIKNYLLRFAVNYKEKNKEAAAYEIILEIEKKGSSLSPQGSIFDHYTSTGTFQYGLFSRVNQDDVHKVLFGESATASAMKGWTFSQDIKIKEVGGVLYIQINDGEPIPLGSVDKK